MYDFGNRTHGEHVNVCCFPIDTQVDTGNEAYSLSWFPSPLSPFCSLEELDTPAKGKGGGR